MNSAYIIKNQLDKIGSTAVLKDGDWTSMPFKCTVSPLWRKKSSAFDDSVTKVGTNKARYHLYKMGKRVNSTDKTKTRIFEIEEDGRLIYNDISYKFLRKNAVKINDETIYYTGILREVEEAQYDEY